MSTLTINVTQTDIAAGVPGDCHDCPIALAAIRACETDSFLPGLVDLFVLGGQMEFYFEDDEHDEADALPVTVDLPGEAQQFIEDFDNVEYGRTTPAPFTFTVELP